MPCDARALSSETPTGSKSRDDNAVHDLHGRTYEWMLGLRRRYWFWDILLDGLGAWLGFFVLSFVVHIISTEKIILKILTQNHPPFPEKQETCRLVAETEVSKSRSHFAGI
jgi:hypothetical protein